MKESSILFNQEMVTAYFENRKTQTRRTAKNIFPLFPTYIDLESQTYADDMGQHRPIAELCPYGQAGDRLWGRETWRPRSWGSCFDWMMIEYKAGGSITQAYTRDLFQDPETAWVKISRECLKLNNPQSGSGDWILDKPLNWRPSIFMPRAAARILPTIKSVRLEMLQSISEADAIAEGVKQVGDRLWKCYGNCPGHKTGHDKRSSATASFMSLWNSINAKRGFGWDVNPPVWVIEFYKD